MSKASAYAAAITAHCDQFPTAPKAFGGTRTAAWVDEHGKLQVSNNGIAPEYIPALIAWLTDTFTDGEGQ